MKTIQITVPASAAGTRLSVWLAEAGYSVPADCGGRGTCGKCRVTVISGHFGSNANTDTPLLPDADGTVLSCHAFCTDTDAVIELRQTMGSGLTEFSGAKENAPSRSAADAEEPPYAALDIGTTTLALALIDPVTEAVISTASALNPQRSFGADVMSRIGAAAEPGNLALMQSLLAAEVNRMLASLTKAPVPRMAVAGNPTMLHLFCGISPTGMGAYPFTPAFTDAKTVPGDTLGLPQVGEIRILPSASAFIGSDVLAGAYLKRLTASEEPAALIDIGTNGEMILFTGTSHGGRLYAASAAAGPALEGAGISTGVGGIPGAVCGFDTAGGGLQCRTIDDAPPIGICGSGLISLAAILCRRGIIDETGYLETEDGDDEFAYAQTGNAPLVLTQEDVRALQLAKSAIRAGFHALCDAAGIEVDEVSHLYLAGGLGCYMNIDDALTIGLLPACLSGRITAIGNSALGGAASAVCDPARIDALSAIAGCCETAELNTSAVFQEGFIAYMMFSEEEDL